jgi:hypothetical protein
MHNLNKTRKHSIDCEFLSTVLGYYLLTVRLVNYKGETVLYCRINHKILLEQLMKKYIPSDTTEGHRLKCEAWVHKWQTAEHLPSYTAVELYEKLAQLNFGKSRSVEWHTSTNNGDVGTVEAFLETRSSGEKDERPKFAVLPPSRRRFSPLRLIRWDLPHTHGLTLTEYQINRSRLKTLYPLLVPDGPHRYQHHDAEIDSKQ